MGVAGWLGGVGGGGAGGFCANATGTRRPIASASWTKMRMRGLTELFLGRERLSRKFSAQVSSSQGFRSEQRPPGWISRLPGAPVLFVEKVFAANLLEGGNAWGLTRHDFFRCYPSVGFQVSDYTTCPQ